MRSGDLKADNLFCRLFSYSPRSNRNPLEDFCTEALVWCLIKSDEVRREFLALLQIPEIASYPGKLEFHTQFAYRQGIASEENEEKESPFLNGGRFDILILARDFSFVIVIEVKVEADFRFNQLKDYRWEINNNYLFKQIPKDRRLIVTITKTQRKPDGANINIQWSQIQELLASVEITDGSVKSMCQNFAEFLEEKGMYPVKIQKLNLQDATNWAPCFKYQTQLWHILNEVRKDDGIKPLLKKGAEIVFDPYDKDGCSIGLYGHAPYWLGFVFDAQNGSPKLKMWVEGPVKLGTAKLEKLLGPTLASTHQKYPCGRHEMDTGKTYLNFWQPVESEINGDAGKMLEWFQLAAHEFADLTKKLEKS